MADLKCEIVEMNQANKRLENNISSENEQLTNTFSIVFERIKNLEKVFELQKVKDVVIDNISPEAEAGREQVQSNEKNQSQSITWHQCNMCDFKGKIQVTVKKHMNIKMVWIKVFI